jgi:glyoxylase-like metal-dependent hydrolase (beta-lactamase superfamily II)/ferredoxin
VANAKKKLSSNIEGNFFVDTTCINCDACRQLAPETFHEQDEYSTVYRQPVSETEKIRAYQALMACPVGSIGVVKTEQCSWRSAMTSFPLRLDEGLYYTGFNSPASFGGNSYFLQHPAGNWLIDSPRYVKHLVDAFEGMGGIRFIFLTHEDDVADSARYAQRFQATRIIHRADLAAAPEAEWVVDVHEPRSLLDGFDMIPLPGHTPGSMALLYKNQYLFTGDHLWWDRDSQRLDVPSVYVWDRQKLHESTRRLFNLHFEWVLPGHGDRTHGAPSELRQEVARLLERQLVLR